MYRYTEMLLELGGFSGKLGRYYMLLDVILVFMASYALVIFTGVHQICAEMAGVDIITLSEVGMEIAAPAVCAVLLAIAAMVSISILLVMFTRRRRDGVCASVGAAYPGLDEPLRTAYDNRGIENVVVDDLTEMVTTEMDKVAYSSFLNRKRITSRVILIILLALFIVSLAVANFSVAESARGVQLPLIGGGGSEGGGGGGDLRDSPRGGLRRRPGSRSARSARTGWAGSAIGRPSRPVSPARRAGELAEVVIGPAYLPEVAALVHGPGGGCGSQHRDCPGCCGRQQEARYLRYHCVGLLYPVVRSTCCLSPHGRFAAACLTARRSLVRRRRGWRPWRPRRRRKG